MPPLASLVLAFVLALHVAPARSVVRPAERTPLTQVELHDVLELGHLAARGRPASRNRLAMAWALVSYENGRGREVFGFNLGNVGPTSRGAPRALLRDGGYYEVFATPLAGATALWTVLATRCPGALRYFDWGLPIEAGAGLRRCGYHRTDERYGRALRTLFYEALQRWPVTLTKPDPG